MLNLDKTKIKKAFFIGIGGIGISALAKMLMKEGIEVKGVNDEDTPKTLNTLREEGAEIIFQKDLQSLPEADIYIYSDAWLYRGPELIEKAKETTKPVMSYFEALGMIAKKYKTIAVSGTHGKTTTTAMIAEIMIDAGLDPTVIVGSFIKSFGSNFRKGNSDYLVVEADEYNKHFLNFYPYIGAVTNIESDHLDCYKDLDDIKNAFAQFISQSDKVVVDYEKYIEKVPKLAVAGKHNRKNAGLALAVAHLLNIPEEKAKESLTRFSGTWRRLEKIAQTKEGTIVYDDYAHHPTEIRASIQALRELYPSKLYEKEEDSKNLKDFKNHENQEEHKDFLQKDKIEKKITIVFQPHLYSRTKAFFNDFAKSFEGVDMVVLLPIYFAREAKDESISSGKLAEEICKNGQKAIAFTDFELAEEYLKGYNFGKNDVFVTMGAGEAYKIANKLFSIDKN